METEFDSCLVLCIEECDNLNTINSIDTRLFITYDFENYTYVIYGKRQNTNRSHFDPYFFRCEHTNDLCDFIRAIIDNENQINVILYNYNNMPINCQSVDYNFMENNIDYGYEIAGYDNTELSNRVLKKLLRMLKNMYNYY
jgi:hypothetical protein